MTNRFSKLLSVILSLAMLVSMCGVTTFADGTEPETGVYYVRYGASGDGLSAETPAGTLETVISAINASYGAGDNVTVYIMNCGSETEPIVLGPNVPYVTWYSTDSASSLTHKATITYKSYDAANKSRIRFSGGFLSGGSSDKYGNNAALGGPSVFDGVDFIVGRIDGNDRVLACAEYSAEFKNCSILCVDSSGKVTNAGQHILAVSNSNGLVNVPTANADTVVKIDNLDTMKLACLDIGGYYGSAHANVTTVENNVTLVLGTGTLNTLRYGAASVATSFGENVNLILNGTTVNNNKNGAAAPNIAGAFQLIRNADATIPFTNDLVSAQGGIFDMTADGVTLDVTAVAGTFAVEGSAGVAYANAGDKIYYTEGSTITVPAGKYTVATAADVAAVLAAVETPKQAGYVFDKWVDDGNGTITATFKAKEAETATYYVKWTKAENRDGSIEKPFKNVVEAINYINANTAYGKGDIVTLKVLNDDTDVKTLSGYAAGGAYKDYFWAYDANGNYIQNTEPTTFFGTGNGTVESRLASWNNGETKYAGGHQYLLVVEGTGTDKDDAYLAQHFAIGRNTQSILSGPTYFKNIKLITNRNVDREWCFDQNEVTFENVKFADPGCQQYSGNFIGMSDVCERESLSALIFNRECDVHEPLASAGNGGVYTFKNVNFGKHMFNTNQTGVFLGKHGITFTEPVTVIFEDSTETNFLWGAHYKDSGKDENTYLNKGLMIVADNTKVNGGYSYNKSGSDLGDTIITGGLTLVSKNGGSAPAIAAGEVTADAIYKLSYNDDVELAITGEKAHYTVGAGVAYTIVDGGKTIHYGTTEMELVLPGAGTYEVLYAENRNALDAIAAPEVSGKEFQGWIETEPGIIVANFGEKMIAPIYVKNGGTGDGSTKATPVGSVAAAIDRVNALGYGEGDKVPVVILEDDTDVTTFSGYASENKNSDKYWAYDKDGNYIVYSSEGKNGRFTYWKEGGNAAANHTATIVVQGETGKTPYLAQTHLIGNASNTCLTLSGPTVFKNINFVVNRNSDRELASNGHEVVLENFSFNYLNHGTELKIQKGNTFFIFSKGPDNSYAEGTSYKATFKNVDFGSVTNLMGIIISKMASGANGFVADYPLIAAFEDSTDINFQWGSDPNYSWGKYQGPTYLNKGITIVADGTNVTNVKRNDTVTVKRGITLVTVNGGTITDIPSNVTYDKLYRFDVKSDVAVSATETAGKIKTDAAGKYYAAYDIGYNAYFGKVAEDGTIEIPAGEWTVCFADTDFIADDFAAMRAHLPGDLADSMTWTGDGTGFYIAKLPEGKQIVPASVLANKTIEYNGGGVYSFKTSSILGFDTNVFERVADKTGTEPVYPVIGIFSGIADQNGDAIRVKNARYATIFYYYETNEVNPPLVGKIPQHNIGNFIAGTTSSAWLGGSHPDAPKASSGIVANKWAYVTIDLCQNAKYKNLFADRNVNWTHNQMRIPVMGTSETLMNYGEKFHVGSIWYTDYDPAEEIANNPQILFVAENGNDENDGLSIGTAIKTFDKVYEIAAKAENDKINVAVYGTVSGGDNFTGECDTSLIIAAGDQTGAIGSIVAKADLEFGNISVENITLDGGNAVLNSYFGTCSDVILNNGILTVQGGEVTAVTIDEGIANAGIVIEGGSVGSVTSGILDGGTLSLGWSAGELGTVAVDGTVENLQVLIDYSYDIPESIDKLDVTGKRFVVTTPVMKSGKGIPFSVIPTNELGVFNTYSGGDINYGYGKTTYICWGVNEAGNKAYYSNSQTGFKLTLPESGTYRLDIAGEKNYTAGNGKKITGFSADTHLVLPEGYIGWDNDGKGTYTAINAAGGASTVYVSNKYGDDDNNGYTKETALKTLQEAILKIGTSCDGTVIILDGDGEYELYTRDNNWNDGATYGGTQNILLYENVPSHTGTITYVGDAADSVLCYGANAMMLSGPSVFKNLTLIEGYNHYKGFSTTGYDCSFENVTYYNTVIYSETDENFKKPNAGVIKNPDVIREIITGEYAGTTSSKGGRVVISDFNSKSGIRETHNLVVGSYNSSYVIDGDITVEMAGGQVGKMTLLSNIAKVKNVNIVNNGGTIGSVVDGGANTTVNAIQVINNDGNTLELPALTASPVLGTWYMNSAKGAEGKLDVTDVAGTFDVISDKYAMATNGSATVFSANGKLIVSAGTWTVTYVDTAPVDFDGTVIMANIDTEIDLEMFAPVTPANKLFVGWAKDEAGTEFYETAIVNLAVGEKAYAQFVDFSTALQGDLSVLGVQIRVAANGVKQGMRFVTQVNKSLLTNLGITTYGGADVQYGTIILPSSFEGADNLTLETPKAAVVPAVNTYKGVKESELTYIQYTAVLTDMNEQNYIHDYNARSYIRYTDKNGVERVAYGQQYGTSLFAAARFALSNDATLDDNKTAILESIRDISINYYDAPVSFFEKWGQFYDNIPKTYEEATEENFAKGEVFYKSASGTNIREIHFVGGTNANAKTATIGATADTHINLINEKDKYDPELQYTWQTRPGFRGESTLNAFKKSLELMSMYDQFVIAGDIIDYLSYGALDFFKENALDKYDNALYVMGAHDFTKQMETGMSDETPEPERFEMLYEYYGQPTDDNPNNIHFSTRLVNDNVILVNLNNGTNYQYRWDVDMANKLQKVVDEAREKGYIVLIFEHEPISTSNPDNSINKVRAYDEASGMATAAESGGYSYYFANGRVHMSSGDTETALAVYDVIQKSSDVIKGIFCGHMHWADTTYIWAKNSDGSWKYEKDGETHVTIPQYTITSNANNGHNGVISKIVVTPADEVVEEEKPLANTYRALTNDKKLTIGYLGGSITYGVSASSDITDKDGTVIKGDIMLSYANRTTTWFEENFPDATIEHVNAGISDTATNFGNYRLEDHLMNTNGHDMPDLVFVEFTSNDWTYDDMAGSQGLPEFKRQIESLVHNIYSHNPYCDIVFVFSARGKNDSSRPAYVEVAEHYGIQYIDMGIPMQKLMTERGAAQESAGKYYYTVDNLHPSSIGYQVYFDEIRKVLNKRLINNIPAKAEKINHLESAPACINDTLWLNPDILTTSSLTATGKDISLSSSCNSTWYGMSRKQIQSVAITPDSYQISGTDAKITFEFTGTTFSGIFYMNPDGINMDYTIDGGEKKNFTIDDGAWVAFQRYNHTQLFVIEQELPYGKHTVELTFNPTTKGNVNVRLGGIGVAGAETK